MTVACFAWGAHASSVLVSAFCGNELPLRHGHSIARRKSVSVEYRNQHARSVRSPIPFSSEL